MENNKFELLEELIQPYLELPFAKHPKPVRQRIANALPGDHDPDQEKSLWDSMSPESRKSYAKEDDFKNDPAREGERQYWFDLWCRVDKTKREIDEWESLHHGGIPSEAKLKEERLAALRAQLADLEARGKLPPFSNLDQPLAQVDEEPQLSAPSEAVGKEIPAVWAASSVSPQPITRHKLRTDLLDSAIDKAVQQAGNLRTADVFLKLKEIALSSEPPFTGIVEGDALLYTDKNNNPARLTHNALDHRLRRHRTNAKSLD